MAEGGSNEMISTDTIDVQIMDCSDGDEEKFECVFPTQNRFWGNNGQDGGWGDKWQHKQSRRAKRKKVSSGSTGTDTDNIDMRSFTSLNSDDKLSCLFELASKNFQILHEVRNEQTAFYKTTNELKASVAKLCEQAKVTERVNKEQTKCMKMLAYRSIDTEARSRRNNVIVWGISEMSNQSAESLISNFFEDELSIQSSDLVIDRAHRIGSVSSAANRNKQDPKRPIIVRFRDYRDTEMVMKNAYKLKGTPFGLDRDYPREIAIARKELYKSDEARQAREKRDKIQIRYPAKLYINGRLECDKFPEWHQYLNENRLSCFEYDKDQSMRNDRHDEGTIGRNEQGEYDNRDTSSESETDEEEEETSSEGSEESENQDESATKTENDNVQLTKNVNNESRDNKSTREDKSTRSKVSASVNINNSPKSKSASGIQTTQKKQRQNIPRSKIRSKKGKKTSSQTNTRVNTERGKKQDSVKTQPMESRAKNSPGGNPDTQQSDSGRDDTYSSTHL